jgi:hypothetical protein
MDLIYFGLGGKVSQFDKSSTEKHNEITGETNALVKLTVEIDEIEYEITRKLDHNNLFVSCEKEGTSLILSISRKEKNTDGVFSDWILEKLNIEVVKIYQGDIDYKLNLKDLLRLIYHNQELNPRKIYKAPDDDNFVTDSELLRKTIFQILIGETFTDFYNAQAKRKQIEKEKAVAKSILDEHENIVSKLNQGREILNKESISGRLQENDERLSRLYEARQRLKKKRPQSSTGAFERVEKDKLELRRKELQSSDEFTDLNQVRGELISFRKLRQDTIVEVTQIKKIIHTHESLDLFDMSTCPYCLKKIEREQNVCVCGSELEEGQFQKFFYSTEEYTSIYKSKQKSIVTIDSAIESLVVDETFLEKSIQKLGHQILKLKESIRNNINEIDAGIDVSQLDKIDDEILKVKIDSQQLNEIFEQEKKRDRFQTRFDSLELEHSTLQLKERELKAKADLEMLTKVRTFSKEYNRLMTTSLHDCKNAKISSEDYMPIINNGEYREASSSVSVRLLYYLTLLKMSLFEDNVPFPKLLLIDTPQTAGVDKKKLNKVLANLSTITMNTDSQKEYDGMYQIILSTGIGIYPEGVGSTVFQKLADDDRLLKKNILE